MIQGCAALVEASSVPGIAESEFQEVQVMTERMPQSAQERSELGDVFTDCCPHPDADLHGIGVIISPNPWRPFSLWFLAGFDRTDARGG